MPVRKAGGCVVLDGGNPMACAAFNKFDRRTRLKAVDHPLFQQIRPHAFTYILPSARQGIRPTSASAAKKPFSFATTPAQRSCGES